MNWHQARHPVAESQLFRALFETSPDAIIVVADSGRILMANPQSEKLFGYERQGLLGLQVEQLLPEATRSGHRGHRSRYMASPRVRKMGIEHELVGLRRNGEIFPVEVGLSPITTSEGVLYAASIRDVSESQRTRQAMARARYDTFVAEVGRLVLESPNYQIAIDGLPALLSAALETEAVAIMFIHPRSTELTVRAATGLHDEMLDALVHAFPRAELSTRLGERDRGAIILSMVGEQGFVDLRGVLAGSGFHDAAVMPLFDRAEPMGMLLALTRDHAAFGHDKLHFLQSVANMLAATVQRSRSEEQLAHAQRLDALGQLTGGIAHDFNNLLTVISGNLQLLESGSCDPSESAEIIAGASRAVERCSTLTRKLLGFARRRRLVPVALPPDTVLAGLADMLGRTLGAGIVVDMTCPDGLPPVYADPGELDTALVNLAINARDAMPNGGRLSIGVSEYEVTSTIMSQQLAAGRYVCFVVADDGIGMSRTVLEHALEPFYTTKGPGKGSGLGLSMVYGFAQQSGGHLSIDSRPGAGTRVTLLLPVATGPFDGSLNRRAAVTGPGHETVLVVEDEPAVRDVAVAFLRSLGYATCEAAGAVAALEQLAAQPGIALLFSDIALGAGMTGFELVREARRLYPQLPVLLTSGYERSSLGGDATKIHALPLLRKPYRREELALAVRATLDAAPAS